MHAERERVKSKGLPIGNLTSQIFANIFLDELDWFIKKNLKIKYYFRYADDFVIIDPNSEYLKHLIGHIKDFLNIKLNLKLHPQKVEIRKFRQGIDFLGYIVLPHYILLRTKTKTRMFKKIQKRYQYLQNNLISQESFNQTLQSYYGILKHCEGHKLKIKINKDISVANSKI